MIIQDEKQALNQGEAENTISTPPVEDKTAGEVATEPQVEVPSTGAEAQGEESTETGQDSTGKGAQNRIRELNAESKANKKLAESKALENEQLRARIDQLVGDPAASNGYIQPQMGQDEPLIKPGEEIDAIEFERRMKARESKLLQTADARAQLRSKQSETANRLTNEAAKVMTDFPILNPNSEQYDPELSAAISEATEAYIQKSPYTASIEKFVSKLMKPYQGSVQKEVGKASEQLVKQAAQAALKPTSIKQTEKSAKEMTSAELKAKLGVVQA